MKLTGQIALVTGASRGVGKGIARGLGEAGATVYVTGRSVDTLVKRVRHKIEADPAEPRFILTVWGTGYKFADA